MPLTLTGVAADQDQQRKAISIWMRDAQEKLIRVFVTCDALWELDRSNVPDWVGALETFAEKRDVIEKTASAKFDKYGADADDQHEDQPVITLRSMDFL